MTSSNAGSDFRSQVLAATDIVQLIGQTVGLKRAGKDYKGLCPFHNEKTPSFKVDPGKQYFYCFGCKASGTAIDFVMKRDRVEFVDALRTLGQMAGLEMPRFGGSKEKTDQRKVLLDAHSAACQFFENLLAHPQAGAAARAYLHQRGITPETVKHFRIGLAPDAWDGLLRSPQAKKFDWRMMVTAGLAKERNSSNGPATGAYDVFRNRLIFPIRNESGSVIAFGGRVMPGSEDPAKYLNSPETPLFSKGKCVFGLDLARQKIVETRTVAVVEGYTDVVVAHQCGVTNVVSILGTAMTEQHLTVLKRFADRIVLLFDADSAGDRAVDRVVELFLAQPIEIAVASMPAGMDPDEFLLQRGAAAFEKLLSEATDVLSYKWKQLQRRFVTDQGDLTSQQKAVQEYLDLLAHARGSGPVDPIRWGQALTRVSRLTEIPVDDLNRRFRTGLTRQGGKPGTNPGQVRESGQRNRQKSSDVQQAQVDSAGQPTKNNPPPRPLRAQDRAERWILGILLAQPAHWHRVQVEMDTAEFTDALRRKLAEIYWNCQRDEGEPVFTEFLGLLGELSGKSGGGPNQAESGDVMDGEPDGAQTAPAPDDPAYGGVSDDGSPYDEPSYESAPMSGVSLSVALTELAVELVDEAAALPEPEATLRESLGFLAMERHRREQQKLLARLRRTSEEKRNAPADADQIAAAPADSSGSGAAERNPDDAAASNSGAGNPGENAGGVEKTGSTPPGQGQSRAAQDELALFEALVKNNQPTNLRRLGPVQRGGS